MTQKIKFERLKKIDLGVVNQLTNLLKQLDIDCKSTVGRQEIEEVVKFPGASVFVARESKGKIIGMVTLIGYPQVGGKMKVWLEDLVIDRNYRRQGVGKKLMDLAVREAKRLKFKSVVFTSRTSRREANRFYKQLGFKTKETNYYRQELV